MTLNTGSICRCRCARIRFIHKLLSFCIQNISCSIVINEHMTRYKNTRGDMRVNTYRGGARVPPTELLGRPVHVGARVGLSLNGKQSTAVSRHDVAPSTAVPHVRRALHSPRHHVSTCVRAQTLMCIVDSSRSRPYRVWRETRSRVRR